MIAIRCYSEDKKTLTLDIRHSNNVEFVKLRRSVADGPPAFASPGTYTNIDGNLTWDLKLHNNRLR